MKRKSCFGFLLALTVSLLGSAGMLHAQAVGQILGTVQDPTGAVVPRAQVIAQQQGTGLTRSTISGNSGTYSIPNLPVGTYTVSAEAGGFKKVSTPGITLDVSQQREINFTLAVAGTTQSVEVNAAPALLNTTNATMAGLVNGHEVSTLPLNGRDITNLVLMQPGVNIPQNTSFQFEGFVASNGNRETTGSSYLDNSDSSDNELGGAQFSNFNLDAIAEFKVLQNNYSAEYGRGSGSVIELVTKQGTNNLHGSLFEFVRNSAFDARNFFSNAPGSAGNVPPFRRNEFGGTFGGPITIPHVYKGTDKTFFFVQYAGYRQRLGEPAVFDVPTAQNREGDVTIGSDQLTVPVNPVAQQVMNRYPLPNDPSGSFGANTYNSNASLPVNRDQWSARIDHHFSASDSIFGRYSWSDNINRATDPVALTESPSFTSRERYNQRNLGLTETHIFSPTLLSTLAIGYTMNDEFLGPGTTAIPYFTFSDGTLSNWGPDTGIFDLHPETIDINEKINWTKNAHSITMGFDFRRTRDDEYGASVGGPQGQFNFLPGAVLPDTITSSNGGADLPAGSASPSSLISFMEGVPSSYFRTLAYPGFGPSGGGFAPFGIRRFNLAGYFQDDYKVTTRLTLNLGLRYEFNSVPYEVDKRMAGIVDDPKIAGGSVYRMLVLNPDPVYRPDYTGFSPRFGLAFKITPATIFRGGFGIFTNLPLIQTSDQQAFGFPFAGSGTTENPPMQLTPLSVGGIPTLTDLQGNVLPPGGNTKNLKPNTPVNLQPVEAFIGGPLTINLTSTSLRNGYTMGGNALLERQLPGDIALQVGYVMNNAVKLYGSEYPNAYVGAETQFTPFSTADPGLGEFQLTDNHAHSTYNALQAVGRKTSANRGITFQVAYTYSKMIDNATTVFNGPAQSGFNQNNPFCWRCEKGPSSNDVPQRLVASFIYNVPFDKWGGLASAPKRLTQGWEATTIIQAQDGFPWSVNSPTGTSEYGIDQYNGYQGTRPDLLQKPTLHSGGGREEQFFSTAVIGVDPTTGASLGGVGTGYFGQPLVADPLVGGQNVQAHPGNLGRNTFRSPAFSNFDFSVIKDTKLTEGKTLQFRAEFFNIFNQHAFAQPSSQLGNPSFGVATSTIMQVPEREIQFALRFIF